ncbi:TPA: hypothetical protein RZJ63_001717, partial [Campylobacter jejuni]|nr:hypothetical protein [Campylobacter jejuni]
MNKKIIKLKLVDWHTPDTKEYFYQNKLIKFLLKRYNIVYSDDPDYLLFGPFGNKHIYYNCIRIFVSEENKRPNWNIADYSIGYDYISFSDRHLRTSLGFLFHERSFATLFNLDRTINYQSRAKFCGFLISDPGSPKWTPREYFIDQLSKYKKLDSGGKWKNNIGGPIGERYGKTGYGNSDQTKLEWLRNYKFNLCFENSSAPGYTSEKIFQAFAAGCIPIYWGDTSLRCGLGIKEKLTPYAEIDQRIPKIPEELLDYKINPKAFINAHNFSTWQDLIDEIKMIDSNEELYYNMLSESIFIDKKFNLLDSFSDDLYCFFDNIFNQDYINAFRRGKGIHIDNDINEKYKIATDKSNIGALLRIQNQLSYKLGQALILNSKSVLGFLSLPFIILSIVISHKQEQKAYKFKIKKNPNLALPPLSSYDDYNEALKIKNHFSYKLGEEFIKASKNWYKGGLFLLPYRVFKLHKKL